MSRKNIYDDVADLLKDLKSDIEDVLMDEVLEIVRDIEMEHVQEDVFSVYSPTIYERRVSGGLDDRKNVVGQVKNGVLIVQNDTPFNEGYGTKNHGIGLAIMVNDGGTYKHDYDYGFRTIEAQFSMPRPFLDNAAEEIEHTDDVENALAKGLTKRKYDVY